MAIKMAAGGKKTIAVVGAGCTGILAMKSCLDEGLEPVCFERTDSIGGLWHYTDDVHDGQASVMKSTIINTSKEMTTFSDFPIPAKFPNFMHNKYVLQYFNMYCEKHQLFQYVRYKMEVVRAEKTPAFSTTGRWKVTVKDKVKGDTQDLTFDAVLICTGHHAYPNMPTFPGQENFKGKIMHSHDYRKPQGFEDKNVVIVGIGNSAGDLAVDIAKHTEQTYISTRRGAWVVKRIWDDGVPVDMAIVTRFNAWVNRFFSQNMANNMAEKLVEKSFKHADYGLKPKHRFFQQHGMVNDEMPIRIASGDIIIKPNIKSFTTNGIEFEDGTTVENVDIVVFSTGYVFGFPFLDKSIIDVKDNQVDLYKYTFPINLEKPTLAVIGLVQPNGSTMTVSEMQCRWATLVFKGDRHLPSKEEMSQDIQEKREEMREQFYASARHTIQVDWLKFMDELAHQVGCKPNLVNLMFTDPKLAMKCIFGPLTPYQYRLEGPGKWQGAREAIMTIWDRCLPVNKDGSRRKLAEKESRSSMLLIAAICLVLASALYYVF